MVLYVRVASVKAEAARQQLAGKGMLHPEYAALNEKGYVLFPVTHKNPGMDHVERRAPKKVRVQTLQDRLSSFSEAELEKLKGAHDVVGSIAIIEIDEELRHREEEIADALLTTYKGVHTVLAKEGGHEGELRLQRYRLLAGKDTRETTVVENGCKLNIDVEAVYYSIRSSSERKRIAALVQPGERVLVMFSGAGPYVCVIGKHSQASEIVGIELNNRGHDLAVENVRLNKLRKVRLIQGDVRKEAPVLAKEDERFDRIVMPLPHTGYDFLDEAFMLAKEGTVIHLYDFEQEEEFKKAAEKARVGAKRNRKKIEILRTVACGQHSPRVYRVCVDFKLLN